MTLRITRLALLLGRKTRRKPGRSCQGTVMTTGPVHSIYHGTEAGYGLEQPKL